MEPQRTIEELMTTFTLFANRNKSKELTSKDLNRWAKDSKVICTTKSRRAQCTSNNLDIAFCKYKTIGRNSLTFGQLDELIWEIASSYQTDNKKESQQVAYDEIINKFSTTIPKQSGITFFSVTGGVDRMTDTSAYTGTHRQRFDSSGRGKGIAGRIDIQKNNGYVRNYAGENMYNKKVGNFDVCEDKVPERKVWIREIVRVNRDNEVRVSEYGNQRPKRQQRNRRVTEMNSEQTKREQILPVRQRHSTVTIRSNKGQQLERPMISRFEHTETRGTRLGALNPAEKPNRTTTEHKNSIQLSSSENFLIKNKMRSHNAMELMDLPARYSRTCERLN